MDMLEKVERLREKANVTYEEAKEALEQCGGDLLDAMVLLERQGKVKEPGRGTYSTEYEEQEEYIKVKDKVEEQENAAPRFGRSAARLFRALIRFVKRTQFIVSRNDSVVFEMPTVVFALLLLFFWEGLVPVMIIALFFNVRYSFEGEEDAEKANTLLTKAGDFADDVRSEFTKKDEGPEEL